MRAFHTRSWLLAATCLSLGAAAGAGNGVTRYHVTETPAPSSGTSACLPGHAVFTQGSSINDFGIVSANTVCYKSVDLPGESFLYDLRGFVWAPYFGARELPMPPGGIEHSAYRIDNRGRAVGLINYSNGSFTAASWSLGGGMGNPFDTLTCPGDFAQQGALGSNARGYVVGWALLIRPGSQPPLDTFCSAFGWAIRAPNGSQYFGPIDGFAFDVNASDVAVGDSGNTAVKMHLPSGRRQVLKTGDSMHFPVATDINDEGAVAGYLGSPFFEGGNQYCPAVTAALSWDHNGRESLLPNLPGMPSSRAAAVGYRGETVGQSGPGNFCFDSYDARERAVIWRQGTVRELTSLIAAEPGITLIQAVAVNRWGQIVANGYYDDEPLALCPYFVYDPIANTGSWEPQRRCRNLHAFILTPRG